MSTFSYEGRTISAHAGDSELRDASERWGTWGFKAIPAGGEQMAELIATNRVPDLIAPFALDRFANDRMMADPGSTGTH
jgi:hypothetical protein